jgi:hypothetical protein
MKKGIHYIHYRCSLKGGSKTKWYKWFNITSINMAFNVNLNLMEKIRKEPESQNKFEEEWKTRTCFGEFTEMIIGKIEELPEDADKKTKKFYENNKIMEMICDDVKEAKEVKKEAHEIIKEIARKAESPWETECFEDKNDLWEYKIGY